MKSFKSYIKESISSKEVADTLTNLGYDVKSVLKSGRRLAVVTDSRSEAIARIMEIFKEQNPDLDKSTRSLNISSLGVVVLDSGVEIIAKPASKNVLKAEQEATNSLIGLIEDAVEQSGRPVDIIIGTFKIPKVVTAGSDHIKGDPKADIALMDDAGSEVGFISHKKEGGAKAFQQYGGISPSAGKKIYQNKLVQDFVSDVAELVDERTNGNDVAPRGLSVWRYLPKDREGAKLAGMSVYGPEWNNGKSFGRESVHCIGQGAPILTKQSEGVYTLTFSESTHYADDINWAFSGDYQAIFAATYRSGRKVQGNNITIKNMRAGIYPYDFIKNRKADRLPD